jgi:hypothetical protein
LDEVIFSYVLGVLEDLGPSGPSEENFDMEAFTEMMEAYVPGFAHIPRWGLAGTNKREGCWLGGSVGRVFLSPHFLSFQEYSRGHDAEAVSAAE